MDNRDRETGISTADLAQAGEKEYDPKSGSATEIQRVSEGPYAQIPDAKHTASPSHDNGGENVTPLFSTSQADNMRTRWEGIQVGFVDEPRGAVQQADQLVAEAIKRLAEGFADQRKKLEDQWGRGDNVSTEDLRISLRRYRSFFERLLTV
jgi:hypothetical protein